MEDLLYLHWHNVDHSQGSAHYSHQHQEVGCHNFFSRLKLDLFANFNGSITYNNLAPSERSKAYLYATDADGNPYSPSWFTINAKSNFEITEKINLTASLENITDQRYRVYSSGISSPGRNLILGLNYNF